LTFMKFEVQGIVGQVQSAAVRLRAVEASNDGGTIFPVSNNFAGSSFPWTEDLLFYSNAPTDLDDPLNSVGAVGNGETVEFDVTAAINGDGTYSFGIGNQSTDVVQYSSKEGTVAPELVIQLSTTSLGSPSITGFSPTSGTIGEEVTISGSDLSVVTQVRFGGAATTGFTVDSPTQIVAQVPEGAVSGKIEVLSPVGDASSSTDFVVPAPPVITSLNPGSGPVATEVAIIGSNFIGATEVSFSGMATVNFTVDSNIRLRAQIPSGATTGKIEVTTPNGTARSPEAFVITLGPGIISFSPQHGIAGTEVTITGVNLAAASSVTFNSIEASTFSVESSEQIRATVPVNASSGPIRVTSSEGTATNATTFRV
ncbi:IPT/TIG domain-containing protein, partial [bacterium]|nr:IPT/TIG domain-containing protein [bacterium]